MTTSNKVSSYLDEQVGGKICVDDSVTQIHHTIWADDNRPNLVGEEAGAAMRKEIHLDSLDGSPDHVTITFGPNIRSVTYSYIRGLLTPSMMYFNGNRELFDAHYSFTAPPQLAGSVVSTINLLFSQCEKPSAFRLILNKIKAFVPFAGNT